MIGQPRLVAKKEEITASMWGILGTIAEEREAYVIQANKWGQYSTTSRKLYFLQFIVPKTTPVRCTGLWLSEDQMEIPFHKQ